VNGDMINIFIEKWNHARETDDLRAGTDYRYYFEI